MNTQRQDKLLNKENVKNTTISIIGLGALGSVVLELLVRAGFKKFRIADPDMVEKSNLHRQTLYTTKQIGMPKVYAANETIQELNKDVQLQIAKTKINASKTEFLNVDLIIDCTDNLKTRFLINDYAKKHNIPWIFGSAIRQEGMVFVTDGSPCFECIFKNTNLEENCEIEGVLNSISNIIGALEVHMVYKLINNEKIPKELLKINLDDLSLNKFKVKKNKKCNACNGIYNYLNTPFVIEKCKVKGELVAKPLKKIKIDIKHLNKIALITAKTRIATTGIIKKIRFILSNNKELRFATTDKALAEKLARLIYKC